MYGFVDSCAPLDLVEVSLNQGPVSVSFAGKPVFMSCVFVCVQADDSACLDVSLAYCDLALVPRQGKGPATVPCSFCQMLVEHTGMYGIRYSMLHTDVRSKA